MIVGIVGGALLGWSAWMCFTAGQHLAGLLMAAAGVWLFIADLPRVRR